MDLSKLQQISLTPGEISIFNILLENGPLPVSKIIGLSKIKKGDCYNKIYSLMEKGLVEERELGKKKHFGLADPRILEDIVNQKYRVITRLKGDVESLLPEIISTYTLNYHAPGVMFFEGEEAMRRVLEDTLTAKTEVVQYSDITPFTTYFPEINATYVRRRAHLKLHKRVILPDSLESREYVKSQKKGLFTGRFLPDPYKINNVTMYIYDNKISYLTLQENKIIGIIIEDALLTNMHRQLFEFNWSKALE
jgi:sugar-specific transcriptional regulator TrmB